MYSGRSISVTGIPASSISLPTPQPLTPPASLTTREGLPMDATINITFGVLMAVLALVGIYQAARLAANHAHRCTSAQFWPTSDTLLSYADLLCDSVQRGSSQRGRHGDERRRQRRPSRRKTAGKRTTGELERKRSNSWGRQCFQVRQRNRVI